jgi:tetratricopeptide (TPR) repeat protein
MSDSHSTKIKPKTILLNTTKGSDIDMPITSKTTLLKPIPLINIEESLETAENLLKSQQIIEGLNEYEQIFAKYHLELSPKAFESKFSEIFMKIAVIAIGFLNISKKEQCFSLLTRCERILADGLFGDFPELKTLIFNHLGCYYRRIEKIETALSYYEKSLEIIKKLDKKKNSGLTHMNLSAIYSQIQRFLMVF